MKFGAYLGVGAWLFLAVAVAQKGTPRHIVRREAPQTADERISSIQAGYESALGDLSSTEFRTVTGTDASGKPITYKVPQHFGLSRAPTLMLLHNGVMRETGVRVYYDTKAYDLAYYSVNELGNPLRVGKMSIQSGLGSNVGRANADLTKEIVKFADRSFATLASANIARGHIGGDEAEARPLRVTDSRCLSCHAHSKIGDPLAIMVYVIKRAKA